MSRSSRELRQNLICISKGRRSRSFEPPTDRVRELQCAMASAEIDGAATAVVDNVRTIEDRMRRSEISSLPERYVWDNAFRDNHATSDERAHGLKVPVVDLAGVQDGAERERIARKIGEGFADWGFVQVINHGVPATVTAALDRLAREFFELPVEIKERAKEPQGKPRMGYGGRLHQLSSNVPWTEYLGEYHSPEPGVQALAQMVWEDGNPTFCKAVDEYCLSMERLGLQLLELVAESLGLQKDVLAQHHHKSSGYMGSWRFNHYPPCSEASRTLGQGPHSDPVTLTILKQDSVGGLEIRRADMWVPVEPVPGAFIVNVGDILQAWSNDKFPSVEHRVVVNSTVDRLSTAFFFVPPPLQLVQAPQELVDDQHPSVFRPFTFVDYIAHLFKERTTGYFGKHALTFVRRESSD